MGKKKGAAAAAAPAPQPDQQQQQQATPASELAALEQRRATVADQLRDVERQIYDLETKYLEHCNPVGNALKGYEALFSAPQTAINAAGGARNAVRDEDRLFSGSSTSGAA